MRSVTGPGRVGSGRGGRRRRAVTETLSPNGDNSRRGRQRLPRARCPCAASILVRDFVDVPLPLRVAGLVFQTTVPGLGTIVKDVGLLVFEPDGDVVIHGPHEQFEVGGYEIYCPYLA